MKKLSLRTFIQNLYSLWVYDYHSDDNRLKREMDYLSKQLCWQRMQNVAWRLKGTAEDNDEWNYVRDNSQPTNFPYLQVNQLASVESGYDKKLKLPFVLHHSQRLYFPHSYSLYECENLYRYLIEIDQILGGGYLAKAPHCYQTDNFKVAEGDVLFDCGAAEGLFSLDVIDKVSHVYLIETDKRWIPALRATFAPYKNKVTIVNKYLSSEDDMHHVSLSSLLSMHNESCFVKMDIEGAETMVLKESKDFLKGRDNIRLACCTYHYQSDADTLAHLFAEIGYRYSFSDGWMFCFDFEEIKPPYMRHGIIRAQK